MRIRLQGDSSWAKELESLTPTGTPTPGIMESKEMVLIVLKLLA